MKRAKRLGRRYIRTLADALRSAFRNPRFQARVIANVTQNNALLRELMKKEGRQSPTGNSIA